MGCNVNITVACHSLAACRSGVWDQENGVQGLGNQQPHGTPHTHCAHMLLLPAMPAWAGHAGCGDGAHACQAVSVPGSSRCTLSPCCCSDCSCSSSTDAVSWHCESLSLRRLFGGVLQSASWLAGVGSVHACVRLRSLLHAPPPNAAIHQPQSRTAPPRTPSCPHEHWRRWARPG